MVPFLLVLTTLLGAVNAKINENLHASRSPFEQRMNVQNAYPTFPSNPTYVVYKQFSDTTCTQLYQVVSFLANTCLAGSESSSKFSCVDGAITRTYYADLACSESLRSTVYTTGGDECTIVPANNGELFSRQTVACDTSAFAFGIGDYAVSVYNQDSSCSQPLVATGNVNNYCYEGHPSAKVDFPYRFKYNTTDCTGVAIALEADVTSCQFTTGADDDDDDFAKDSSYNNIYHYVAVADGGGDDKDGLSDGAIAGIAIGATAGAIMVVLCLMWCLKVGMFSTKAPLTAQQEMSGGRV